MTPLQIPLEDILDDIPVTREDITRIHLLSQEVRTLEWKHPVQYGTAYRNRLCVLVAVPKRYVSKMKTCIKERFGENEDIVVEVIMKPHFVPQDRSSWCVTM
jgi:hypothetical protein